MARFRQICSFLALGLLPLEALGQTITVSTPAPPEASDDIVRLPGQGEVKREVKANTGGADRLIAGGGLILSFDADGNGRITPTEVEQGAVLAFATADENEDGRMTPLEQMAWADSLPTRDTSLANPARFDPNLDRTVREAEFTEVVIAFAEGLRDETTGDVHIESLKSRQQGRRLIEEPVAPPRREPVPDTTTTEGDDSSDRTARGS